MDDKYKELPVYKYKDKIVEIIKKEQVVIIESPTGSGKTTQLPIILYDAFSQESSSFLIGVTQPRRIATYNVKSFINKCRSDIKTDIKIRFDDTTDEFTQIKLMTDGILLEEFKTDPYLSKYNIIMIDEAHERSLNIDFLLGLLKELTYKRSDLKIIISSATINTQEFSVFFNNAKIISIPGKSYDVEIKYTPLVKPRFKSKTLYDLKFEKIIDIIKFETKRKRGDILIFLSGEGDIKKLYSILKYSKLSKHLELYPLYSRLSKEVQNSVFNKTTEGKTKVVIATNIAETSITIENITTVIDSGFIKNNYYNQKNGSQTLSEVRISKSNAEQRAGRAGRTSDGVCYRLYSKQDYESRDKFPSPEIIRSDLSDVVLRAIDIGIKDAFDFPFISDVKKEAILYAYETLMILGAIDNNHEITKKGYLMMKYPLSVRHARTIIESIYKYPGAIRKVIIVVAFLSSKTPFVSVLENEEEEALNSYKKYKNPIGDFYAYLDIYFNYINLQTKDEKLKFCKDNYFDPESLYEIEKVVTQLEDITSELGIPLTDDCSVMEFMLCIASGFYQYILKHVKNDLFVDRNNRKVNVSERSLLSSFNTPYLVASEINSSRFSYARNVGILKTEWVKLLEEDNFYNLENISEISKDNDSKKNVKYKNKEKKTSRRNR